MVKDKGHDDMSLSLPSLHPRDVRHHEEGPLSLLSRGMQQRDLRKETTLLARPRGIEHTAIESTERRLKLRLRGIHHQDNIDKEEEERFFNIDDSVGHTGQSTKDNNRYNDGSGGRKGSVGSHCRPRHPTGRPPVSTGDPQSNLQRNSAPTVVDWAAGGGATTAPLAAGANANNQRQKKTGPGAKKTSTTTMFINQDQCVYVERALGSGHKELQPATRAIDSSSGVRGGSGGGFDRELEANDISKGSQPKGGLLQLSNDGSYAAPCSTASATGEGDLSLLTTAVTSSTTPSVTLSNPTRGSIGASGVGGSRENDFAKKLKLVTHRPKIWDGVHGRQSVNLPMRIKVHIPCSSTSTDKGTPVSSGVSRERLLLEKARRDIRDILKEGSNGRAGPESNRSVYSTATVTSSKEVSEGHYYRGVPQAKLTPVLFPPELSDPLEGVHEGYPENLEYSYGAEFGNSTMLAHYQSPPQREGNILMSTHRVPLSQRAQTAHVGRAATARGSRNVGNGSRPGSPGYASRPMSALSMHGMPRSRSSSISDNPPSETDIQDVNVGREKRAVWPSLIDVQRLKIGGFRYKNKKGGGTRAEARTPASQEEYIQEQSIEAKKKAILNLGTIIVPSHTCVDCPLCNLYYAKEDLWPDGPHKDHSHTTKNANNNNNNAQKGRRAKSAKPYNSTRTCPQEEWDEIDLSKAAVQLNKVYSVPEPPQCSPEPESARSTETNSPSPSETKQEIEPETVTEMKALPEMTSLVEIPKLDVRIPTPQKKAVTKQEVSKQEVSRLDRRPGSAQTLLTRRSRSANLIQSSKSRNPFKNFRNEGVSVTVRIPVSPTSPDQKQKAQYEQVVSNMKVPVTFKFSYVKVNTTDLLQPGKRQT